MPITHQWNGTVLTITSDSGTSSADLKGQKGDDGARGPQGQAGSTIAENTSKLDGKEAKYYIQPYNLLDNSNFEIAQAGYNGYHGSQRYSADRWLFAGTEATATYSKTTGLTIKKGTTETYIEQILSINITENTDKKYTFALMANGNIYTLPITLPNAISRDISNGNMLLHWYSNNLLRARVRVDSEMTLLWVALYEGEYTAETLPPYIPKGYAVELAECQRYYYKFTPDAGIYGYIGSAGNIAYAFINLPQCMRTQAVSIEDNTSIVIALNGGTYNINTFTSNIARGNQLELKITFTDTKPSRIPIGGWVARGAVSADL